MWISIIVGQLLVVTVVLSAPAATSDFTISMPDVQPLVDDTYLCRAFKMDKEEYLVGFETHANSEISHHVLLFGCSEPPFTDRVWNCGGMEGSGGEQHPVCNTRQNILYAWAMDAPALHLPPGVGAQVGPDSPAPYLVLQVHYKNTTAFKEGAKDNTGITITETTQPQPHLAGVIILGTGGQIPPHSRTYLEVACNVEKPIHPFAFRIHAHTWGQVVSGFVEHDGKWTELGRKGLTVPQMFYNLTNPVQTIYPDDTIAARCTFRNDEDRTVYIGATQNDEMCNFYIMYYVDDGKLLEQDACWSPGNDVFENLGIDDLPDEMSIIPGTTEFLPAGSLIDEAIESQENAWEEIENALFGGQYDAYDDDSSDLY